MERISPTWRWKRKWQKSREWSEFEGNNIGGRKSQLAIQLCLEPCCWCCFTWLGSGIGEWLFGREKSSAVSSCAAFLPPSIRLLFFVFCFNAYLLYWLCYLYMHVGCRDIGTRPIHPHYSLTATQNKFIVVYGFFLGCPLKQDGANKKYSLLSSIPFSSSPFPHTQGAYGWN
jgi:hypothetical protein